MCVRGFPGVPGVGVLGSLDPFLLHLFLRVSFLSVYIIIAFLDSFSTSDLSSLDCKDKTGPKLLFFETHPGRRRIQGVGVGLKSPRICETSIVVTQLPACVL